MANPQQTYSNAILRACEAHLVRVNTARIARDAAIAKAREFSRYDASTYTERVSTYAAANREYDTAIRNSDARRLKDEANALTAFQTRCEVS